MFGCIRKMMTGDELGRAPLVDAVGNKTKHEHHCGEQPHHCSGVLPRVSDVVVGAATVLALLSVRKERHYDYYANTDQREHSASSEVGLSNWPLHRVLRWPPIAVARKAMVSDSSGIGESKR